MRRFQLILLIIFLVSSVPGRGQQPPFQDPLLDQLVGHWTLEGTIAHKKTTHAVDAEWVMGHQYLRIHEVAKELKADGEPAYEATVFIGWNAEPKEYGCVWLDRYGGLSTVSVGTAKRSESQIPFTFHELDCISFHNTCVYHRESDIWEWNMESVTNGKLDPFARVTLTRVK